MGDSNEGVDVNITDGKQSLPLNSDWQTSGLLNTVSAECLTLHEEMRDAVFFGTEQDWDKHAESGSVKQSLANAADNFAADVANASRSLLPSFLQSTAKRVGSAANAVLPSAASIAGTDSGTKAPLTFR